MMRQTVIVTDGNQRAALSIVRSLGKAGFRCIVTSPSSRSIAGISRYAAREVVVPDPLDSSAIFVEKLVALTQGESAALVIPVTEPALLAVLPVRERFEPAVIPFADTRAFSEVSDKLHLLQEAELLGIAVPQQVVVADAAAAADFQVDAISYPVVLKPARSVGEHDGQRSKVGVSYARDPNDLRHRLDACRSPMFPLLLQQRIVGPGTGVFLLIWDGQLLATFAHRRLWEKPPSGGVSVYCESVAIDETLLAQSRALLDRFRWRGVAMVEYKRDHATGKPYLMEINGRFWGSLQLAVDAGVDFPRLLADAALESPIPPMPTYRIGARCRWWWGQVDHLLARIRRPGMRALLPPGTPGMISALAQLLVSPLRFNEREEVFRRDDPLPFLHETLRWFQGK